MYWVVSMRLVLANPYQTPVGVYSTPEKAKKAASSMLQAEALGEDISWTSMYGFEQQEHEVIGYEIWEGRFKNCASIHSLELDVV